MTLTGEDARLVADLMARNEKFRTPEDVMLDALARLRDDEAGFERWLREDVLPTYDRFKADPGRGLSADEVLARLRRSREGRAKTAAE